MDLSSFKSLHPCGRQRFVERLENAKKEVEIYVESVDPTSYGFLDFINSPIITLITSLKTIQKSKSVFASIFKNVLYESMEVFIDKKRFTRVKLGRQGCKVIIALLTLVLIFFPLTNFLRSAAFFLISLITWMMSQLFQTYVNIEISQIRHRTQFKVIMDLELTKLPSLYIVDDEQVFIGSNVFQSGQKEQFYEITSFEEQAALKVVYRNYAASNESMSDEKLIAKYLKVMGWGGEEPGFP